MRTFLVALAASSALVSVVHAQDKPLIGSAPAWVKPSSLPAPQAKPDEAPFHILLADQQISFEAGRQTVYSEIAIEIQTPQGLTAGNISFPWRPDTDILTVHKLRIRRGSQTIDVLASGQTFTVVRREQNLESATLDGVLTANIQPEGLQVGDILEFAASVSSSDPVLKGHVEQIAGAWNQLPIKRAHLRMQWPNSLAAKFRTTAALPAVKAVKTANGSAIELSLDNIEPIIPPKGAPARYGIGRLVELTDFASWADLGALLAPLYQKASVLPAEGPLHAELERIRTLSPDPKIRTEAALALVQDRVRYVALAMGAGGLVPADAETTWSRRYGDCKAKTALLLALLHALDIQAEPVLVSTTFGDGLDARLPMVGLFNHVLVRTTIAGRTYWLDGTRTRDTSLDRLEVPAFGWGLPLAPTGAALVRMVPSPLEKPTNSVSIHIDATAGLTVPAPIKIDTILRGDDAIATSVALASLTGEARTAALRDYWKGQYDFVEMKSSSATFDAKSGEQRIQMEGVAQMDWSSGWYETDGTRVGYKADFSRPAGQDQAAPFAVAYPYYTRTEETILLPPGFSNAKADLDADVNQTVAGIEYRRKSRLDGNTFTVEKTERSVAPEFPAKDAAAAQAALRKLADATLYIRKPSTYTSTPQEITAMLATTPTTADAFITRGGLLLDRQRYDEAIKDFEGAMALDPKSAWALADRGIARVWKGDYDAARKDLDAAAAIDAKNVVVFRARGLLAQRQGALKDAVAAYTKALEIQPDDTFSRGHRADANRAVGNDAAALEDAATTLKSAPQWLDLYLLRANILRSQGKQDEALKEAEAVQAASPDISYAHVVAASIYSAFHKDDLAMKAYDRAIAIKPEAYIYLNRSLRRPRTDVAGRRADLEAALKMDPQFVEAIAAKAHLQADEGDLKGAVATYSSAIEKQSDDPALLVGRGISYLRSGDTARADKDFSAARSNAVEANAFNSMCWSKATAGVALDSALTDCNTALTKQPDNPSYLDSRGLVFLRLGRIDDAIADYDRALSKNPILAGSLFGRSLALARKGDKAKSDADLAAALKTNPDVQTQFEGYGVKR